jgi:hypothetical protein
MSDNPEVTFLKHVCIVKKSEYQSNNRIALELESKADGEPFAVATVNVFVPMKKDEVAIKNYSENEGIREALQLAKIIGPPLNFISQDVSIHKCLI